MRQITYGEAIKEALDQAMDRDPSVIIIGEGTSDPTGMFGSTLDLHKKYGENRVLDVPNSENAFTGMATGAALNGLRPVIVHQRNDFLLLSMDQMLSQAAKWSYMFSGKAHVPLIVRAVVGRGWGQGAQHSQSLQSLFMHFPGLKVIMPTTPYDAKGLLLHALTKEVSPIIFIEHRWLYKSTGDVPKKFYTVPFGEGKIVRKGKDVTIVSMSQGVDDSMKASVELEKEGIDSEIIDMRTLRPIDAALIRNSVSKTGRLAIVDVGWKTCGVSAEVSALVSEDEKSLGALKAPIKRISWAETPAPTTYVLESLFYPTPATIAQEITSMFKKHSGKDKHQVEVENQGFKNKRFTGSF